MTFFAGLVVKIFMGVAKDKTKHPSLLIGIMETKVACQDRLGTNLTMRKNG